MSPFTGTPAIIRPYDLSVYCWLNGLSLPPLSRSAAFTIRINVTPASGITVYPDVYSATVQFVLSVFVGRADETETEPRDITGCQSKPKTYLEPLTRVADV